MSKRTEKDRTTLKADAAQKKEEIDGQDETTEDWWKVSGKYDYFLSKKTYVFGEGIYETDKIAELDRRVILGGGLGYQWIEKETQNFSTEFGLASVYEKYETDDDSETNLSLQAGYHYDQKFNETFSFIHDLTYYPSTEDFSDYLVTSSAELRAKINDHLFTNFKVLFDYDATPASGQGSTDTKYMFGIGINF
jgi:putative salt-induced outer membrane protein YdiY